MRENNSAFELFDLIDSARIASNAALSCIAFLDTICAFEQTGPELQEEWLAIREDLVKFPIMLGQITRTIDDFVVTWASRKSRGSLPRSQTQAVRVVLRKLYREISQTGKFLEPIATDLFKLSPLIQAEPGFSEDVSELMLRGYRLTELMMPDQLFRADFLNWGTRATVHLFDVGFVTICAGHVEGPLRPVRHMRIRLAIHQTIASLERLPESMREEGKAAFMWPMRRPGTHYSEVTGASLLALRRHLLSLKFRVKRQSLEFERVSNVTISQGWPALWTMSSLTMTGRF